MANRESDPDKIKVNGVELAYRFDGPENAHVVMMSNSLMSNYGMWDVTVPALTDRYRVLRCDTRGHGRSGTTPGPYSIEMLADDAIGLIDQLGIRRVHFVGLSMGGMIAQQIGARYADRVYSLSRDAAAIDVGGALPDGANQRHRGPARRDDPALVHPSVHRP
jgi:3-oxoadipate enol-lactonase